MRYVSSASVVFLSILASSLSFGQSAGLSITNYHYISEQKVTITQSDVTYSADVVNSGNPLASATATLSSLNQASFTVVQGTLTFAPVPGNGGQVTSSNTFTIRVDRSVTFSFANLQWAFQTTALPPVANAGANQTAHLGDTVTLNGSGSTNPSGVGTLTYNWTFSSRPPGSNARLSSSAAVMPTFVVDVPGNYIISLTVSNGRDSSSISVTVSTVNSPPVANAGPNQTVPLRATVTLNGSKSSDVDGDTLNYKWKFVSVPQGSLATLTGANTVSPTFVADIVGSYIVQLIVNDGTSDSLPAQVTITTQNTAPVANAGPNQLVNVGALVQLNGSASTDVDGDPLTYKWSLITFPAGSTAHLSSTSAVNPTFTVDKPGTYVAQLIVNDGVVDSTASTVTITTNSILAPTADAGPGQTVVHGTIVSLAGKGSDPQGLPLTFNWSIISKPGNSKTSVTVQTVTAATMTFLADAPGLYTAQLIVNNGYLNSSPSTVNITTTDTPPVANAGLDQNVLVGTTVTMDGSKSADADNDSLSYSWSILSKPANSNATLSQANSVNPLLMPDLPGTYVLQLIVSDQFASSQPATATVTAVTSLRMMLTPNPLNLSTASPATLTVTLPYPAPVNGVLVSFVSQDTTVASVSPSVLIPQGSTGGNVTVTGVGAGGTTIVATAPSSTGYQPGSGTVNVTAAGLSLSLDSNNIGITRTINGTITLSTPPPAGGLTVGLSALPNGVVTIQPASVTISSGTTGSFTVTGASVGPATITATATGYASGSAAVNVGTLGAIFLPSNVTVAPGHSVAFPVSLSQPAPVGGTTVALLSLDPTTATVPPSVFIDYKNTTPATQPQVTGVKTGPVTISATSPGYTGDSKQVQVVNSLQITTTSLANGVVGTSYSQPVTATGGTGAVHWTLTAGSMPPGLNLSPSTGQISGTPQIPLNNTPLTFQAVDSGSPEQSATASLTLTITNPLQITTTSLTNGVLNAPYSQTLAASGGTGPYSWQQTGGSLPSGLSFNTSTGAITGTPTTGANGTQLSFKVTDSSTPALTATATLSLTVSSSLSITTGSLANGVVNAAYSQSLSVAGGAGPYTWQLNTGTLPAGLGLNTSTGVISGTPLAAVTNTPLSFKVTDSSAPAQTASATLSLTIVAQLTITTTTLPNSVVGTAYSQALTATGGTGPYSWQLTGTLPSGLSFNQSTGQISGTALAAAPATSLTFKVTDSGNPQQTATASLSITVATQLTITTTTLPNGTTNVAYAASLSASGGSGALNWSATGLPNGLSINAATGAITGTASSSGNSSVIVTVKDSGVPQQTATATLSLTISAPLTITTSSLPGGVSGIAYTANLTASGGSGALTWSAPNLPAGLSLNASTGVISGTPSSAGTTSLSITVTDSGNPQQSANATLALTIAAQLTITTTSLPDGMAGAAYNATVAATGGSSTLAWSALNLPTGLSIDPASGIISGTPTAAGTSLVAITVKDSGSPQQTARANVSLKVDPQLTITTNTLPSGTVGMAYSASVSATGGSGSFVWSAPNLPAGLSINPSTGAITGTPSAAGTTSVAITAKDASNTLWIATANLSVTIAPQLSITTTSLPGAVAGTGYNASVNATGGTGTLSWSANSLPSGLTINGATGAISGTTSSVGNATVAVTVKDSGNPQQTATANLTLSVAVQLQITTNSLPSGQVNTAYSQVLAATGGTGAYTWQLTAGTLPAGLNLNPPSGAISGTPTAPGSASLTFKVTDSGSPAQTASLTLSLAVGAGPLAITTTALPDGAVNSPYSFTLTATGGTGPFTWSVATGRLPSGLTLNSATGLISGTPLTTTGGFITFQVTDSGSPVQTASATLLLNIQSDTTLVLTTVALATGQVGVPYSQTLTGIGGKLPYTWAITLGSLPPGLSLNPSTGTISGTPLAAVTNSRIIVLLTDSNSPALTASASFFLTIASAPVAITTTNLPAGSVGVAYAASLVATGGTTPYGWQLLAGSLPAGLSLGTSTGQITGTPTTPVSNTPLTFKVTDSSTPAQSSTVTLALTINSAGLTITTSSLPGGIVGVTYTGPVTAVGGTGALTWSASNLPSGLSIDPSSGVITGTPVATGSNVVTIGVHDSGVPQQTASANLTLSVDTQLSITTTSLPGGDVGTAYAVTLTATGGTGTYTWSATGLPNGLSLNASTGAINGIPLTAGNNTVAVTVTDNGTSAQHSSLVRTARITFVRPQIAGPSSGPSQTATASFPLNIAAQLNISTSTLPNGTAGTPYTATLAATGGTGSLTWSATGLPTGLTLNPSTGVISGTVLAPGTSGLFISVRDSGSPQQTATANLSLTIAGPTLTITSTSLPNGEVNHAYLVTLTAAGGTGAYSWSVVQGRLPSGLNLNSATGQITGTPTTATGSIITFQVMDSGTPPQTATAQLQLTVVSDVLTVTTTSLPAGQVGVPYSATLTATGGTQPYNWFLLDGFLPQGLSLNAATGLISGTPTLAVANLRLVFNVTDAGTPQQEASQSLPMTMTSGPLSITTTSLASGTVGAAYSVTEAASGGTGPYNWSATGLPSGLSINSSTGVISGTPSAAGTSSVVVIVNDSSTPQQTANKTLSLVIAPPLTITTTTLPGGAIGAAYSVTLAASGGTSPLTWSATGLPNGLSINASTGVISGTPTAAGPSSVQISAKDSGSPQQTANATLSLTIASQLTITTTSLPGGVVNSAYNAPLTAGGGTGNLTWSATSLPNGLNINSSTGAITGTPTSAGTATVAITVKDSSTPQQTATASLSLTIAPQLTITTTTLPNGAPGSAYSATLAAAGGTGNLSWSATGLPNGLSINASTSLISGTPSAAGTASVAITVKDSGNPQQTATVNLSLVIATQLTVSNTSLPGGVVNSAYNATLSATGGTGALTWSAPNLPAGLSINASTGAITGTPSAAGTTVVNISVHDSGTPQQSANANLSLTIAPQLTITTSTLPNGAPSIAYTATLAATGGTGALSWSATGLPSGLSIDSSSGAITGTPSAPGTSPVTISASDSGNPKQTATANLSITIATQLSITNTSLPGGAVGTAYNTQLTATGGTGAQTWAAQNLPNGLSINASSGAISGTPSAAGTATVVISVHDSASPQQTANANLSLTIAPQLTITTTSPLQGGAVGLAYSAALAATGGIGAQTWSVPNLPPGLTLNTSTGAITGTPSAAGTTVLQVSVKDSGNPQQTANASLSLTIAPQLSITTTSLPAGAVGTAYSAALGAAGGSGALVWSSPNLPPGLSINASTGAITGTPTTAGNPSVTINVHDAGTPQQSATATLSLAIAAQLTITTNSLPGGAPGTVYSATLAASGGSGALNWQATGLPSGLSINASTGVISGTPATSGTSPVTITVKDSGSPQQTATANLSIAIATQLAITTTSMPAGVTGAAYAATLTAAGGSGALTWSSSALPAGILLNAATGALSGTPSAVGSTSVQFSVHDSGSPQQTANATISITIAAPLAINTASLPGGAVGTAYSATLTATGGSGALTWSSSNLVAGLTLNPSTGAISGTPANAGATNVSFSVKDSGNPAQTANATISLTIAGPLAITTTSLPNGVTGAAYSAQLAATGGTGSKTWTSSALPSGLTLNPSTGLITGTPATAGTVGLSITVQDSGTPPQSVTVSLPLVIASPLTITTASMANGVVNSAYNATLASSGGTGPFNWSATGLPNGLSISTAGVISGTPTASGTATVAITVKDSANPQQSTTANLSLTVAPQLSITTTTLPGAVAGVLYSAPLAASGGAGNLTWSATNLPSGLSMNPSNGAITGTPAAAGTATIGVTVKDSGSPQQTATASLSLTIAPQLVITTTSPLPTGLTGSAYTATVAATGGTGSNSWSATGLPAGLSINASTGAITGTPSASGTVTVGVTVKDSGNPQQSATANLSLTITPKLTITTTSLPNANLNTAYSTTVQASGGTGSLTWSATGLPNGLTINASTGAISGTPSAAGTATVAITVKDSGSPQQTATANLSLTVSSTLAITTAALPGGQVGTAYSFAMSASGGTLPYTWSLSGGTVLPDGLAMDSTGLISGTPTTAVTNTSFNIQVLDTSSPRQGAVQTFTITILPQVVGGTITVGNASVGTNLQTLVPITLPAAPPSGGVPVTISSSSSARVRIVGPTGPVQSLTINSVTTQSFFITVVGGILTGSATLSAQSTNSSGSGTITVTNSAFILSTGSNVTQRSFTTDQGSSTNVTVSAARLDAGNNFAEVQQLAAGSSAQTVNLTNTGSASVGSLSASSVTFNPGDSTQTVTFTAFSTGSISQASASISAQEPSGFNSPNDLTNSLTAFVPAAGITACNTTVGNLLETVCNITLTGTATVDTNLVLTSLDTSKLVLSNTANAVGSGSIKVIVAQGHSVSADFYVQGRASSGTAQYTVNGGSFGNGTGTITLAPSGFVLYTIALTGGGLGADFGTTTAQPATVSVFSAILNPDNSFNGFQTFAGPNSVNVTVTSTDVPCPPSPCGPGVGSMNPSTVTFTTGSDSVDSLFQPGSAGKATVAAQQPSGFNTPSQYASVTATVAAPGINLLGAPFVVGNHLEAGVQVVLGSPAPQPSGLTLTVTVTSGTSVLAVAGTTTAIGGSTAQITVPGGQSSAIVILQGLADSGTATFTVSAPKYSTATATATLAPALVALSPIQTSVSHSAGASLVASVNTGISDGAGGLIPEPLAPQTGSTSISVPLNNGNNSAGTIPASVTVPAGQGDSGIAVLFTPSPSGAGQSTTISLGTLPAPFGAGVSSVTVNVN
jgi:hypothetical protein